MRPSASASDDLHMNPKQAGQAEGALITTGCFPVVLLKTLAVINPDDLCRCLS